LASAYSYGLLSTNTNINKNPLSDYKKEINRIFHLLSF